MNNIAQKESIEIRNFGPIKELILEDIKPLTVIIGSSGVGKSTLMKVLALFRWIYKMINIRSYLSYSGIKKSPFKFRMDSYIKNGGWEHYISNKTYVRYTNGDCTLTFENKKLKGTSTLIKKEALHLEKISFISDNRIAISNILTNKLRSDSFYLTETLSDFNEALESIKDYPIDYLGVKFSKQREKNGTHSYKVSTTDYSINVSSASSGTQSLIPLGVIVEYFAKHFQLIQSFNRSILRYVSESDCIADFKPIGNIGDIPNKRISMHIEEPELSLSPNKQIALLNELIRKCITEDDRAHRISLMLTTHSPYIINQLNLLILAAQKGQQIEGANLKFQELEVYHFTDSGELRSLKAQNKEFIDTLPLSEDIENIYNQYQSLYEA